MKAKLFVLAVVMVAALVGSAFAGAGRGDGIASLVGPGTAQAAPVAKSSATGGGGGEAGVNGAGARLGDLISRNGVPVLIAFAGVLLIGALASRNMGASLGIVLITLIGLMFLLAPDSIAAFAKGVANVVF